MVPELWVVFGGFVECFDEVVAGLEVVETVEAEDERCGLVVGVWLMLLPGVTGGGVLWWVSCMVFASGVVDVWSVLFSVVAVSLQLTHGEVCACERK